MRVVAILVAPLIALVGALIALAVISALSPANQRPWWPLVSEAAVAEATLACEPPALRVELARDLLCVRGLTDSSRRAIESSPLPTRSVQWTASDVLRRQDGLGAAWPTGVSHLRISQGSFRDVPGLVPTDLPGMLERREGRFTYHYPQALRFGDERLIVHCLPTLLPAAPDTDVKHCTIFVSLPGGLRLKVSAYAGAFYDGVLGWPTLLRDYDPVALQAALDEVAVFLDLVLIAREALDAGQDEVPETVRISGSSHGAHPADRPTSRPLPPFVSLGLSVAHPNSSAWSKGISGRQGAGATRHRGSSAGPAQGRARRTSRPCKG
jgi:hypothetical protein